MNKITTKAHGYLVLFMSIKNKDNLWFAKTILLVNY